jgi:hypothetical protein
MANNPVNKQSTIDSSTFINAKADISALYTNIVNIVLSMRSDDPLKPGQIPARSDEDLGSVAGESTLNALYRAIGLPAARRDSALTEFNFAQKSQDGTINYFTLSELGLDEDGIAELETREKTLAQNRPLDVPPPASPSNILRGTKLMIDRVLPNAGVPKEDSRSDQPSSRQKLFPMVVCGDVTVYPRERATAPLFYDNESFVADIRQQRPLIEYIILSKLAPLYDEQAAAQLVDSIVKTVSSAASAQTSGAATSASVEQLRNELQRSEGQSLLSLRLIQKLYSFVAECAGSYSEVREAILRALERVSYVPVLNGRSPDVRQGSYDITYDDQIRLLKEAGADGVKLAEKIKAPTLDKEIAELETEIAKLSVFFTLGSSASASVSDTVTKIADLVDSEKARSDTFEDIILQICTVDREELRTKLATKLQERDRQRADLEQFRKFMDAYTGETLGFSIFDFLAIMIALYTSPVNDLVGLLNKDARARLFRIPGLNTLAPNTSNPFEDINSLQFLGNIPTPIALERLQGRVSEVLNFATAVFEAKKDKK